MRKYSNKRYKYVTSYEDIQRIYKISDQHALCVQVDKEYTAGRGEAPLRYISRVQDGERYYKITSMWIYPVELEDGTIRYDDVLDHPEVGKYVCTWIFDKTEADVNRIHPSRVSKIANHVYKPAKAVAEGNDEFDRTEDGKIVQSAKPIIGYNEEFNNTEHNVVVYDLNSAYAEALADKIIDTYKPRYFDFVGKDEVGFMFKDNDLKMVKEGKEADIVFPIIESPYKDFARKYYDIKKTAPKGSKERDFAKQILVITVGLFQKTNPYLRAYIVGKCNEKIAYFLGKYKDKICMWNTDAIYATEHIEELDNLIGDNIGQFKIEYEGLFRQKGQNYQEVEIAKTSYRGVLKTAFGKDFNLLTDGLPTKILPYKIDSYTCELVLIKEYEYGETI